MRKIILRKELDANSFMPQFRFVVKDSDNQVVLNTVKEFAPSITQSRYTKEEQELIDQAEILLQEYGLDAMTEEEMDYLVDPLGLKNLETLNKYSVSQEDLQKLSGFRVEKRIVPYPLPGQPENITKNE